MNDKIQACKQAAAALSAMKAGKVEPIPKGWFDTAHLSMALSVSSATARRMVTKLRKFKLVEEKRWPALDSEGRLQQKRIYRNL